jgi:hypothetical protein
MWPPQALLGTIPMVCGESATAVLPQCIWPTLKNKTITLFSDTLGAEVDILRIKRCLSAPSSPISRLVKLVTKYDMHPSAELTLGLKEFRDDANSTKEYSPETMLLTHYLNGL